MHMNRNFHAVIDSLEEIAQIAQTVSGLHIPLEGLSISLVKSPDEYAILKKNNLLATQEYLAHRGYEDIKSPQKLDAMPPAYGCYMGFTKTIILFPHEFDNDTQGAIESTIAHELVHVGQFNFESIRHIAALSHLNPRSDRSDVSAIQADFPLYRSLIMEGHAIYTEIKASEAFHYIGKQMYKMHREIIEGTHDSWFAESYAAIDRIIRQKGKEYLLKHYQSEPLEILQKL